MFLESVCGFVCVYVGRGGGQVSGQELENKSYKGQCPLIHKNIIIKNITL